MTSNCKAACSFGTFHLFFKFLRSVWSKRDVPRSCTQSLRHGFLILEESSWFRCLFPTRLYHDSTEFRVNRLWSGNLFFQSLFASGNRTTQGFAWPTVVLMTSRSLTLVKKGRNGYRKFVGQHLLSAHKLFTKIFWKGSNAIGISNFLIVLYEWVSISFLNKHQVIETS